MIRASGETVAILAPATMEIVKKVAADGTVDTIAEAVGTELTTDIKEEIEGKMEIEENGAKVVSIVEKIASVVVERADGSTVHGAEKMLITQLWMSDRVDSMTTVTDAIAVTTAAGASLEESAKAVEIDKGHVTSTVTASATIDREQDNTTTIGDLASIDRATIDADAMMMTVAIDVEVDEVLEADTTIVQTIVRRGFSTFLRVSRPTKKLRIRNLSKRARISTNTTTSTSAALDPDRSTSSSSKTFERASSTTLF